MWTTGGRPPPFPTNGAAPKPASPSHYTPSSRSAELEALRQRGLAKLLNQHFTDTTAKLAAEKAAADAALRDLQARKAATGEFRASGDGPLSPLDSLYLSVHAWRNECRLKERETLLLYQRYVHKFGATGRVQVPVTTTTPSGSPTKAPMRLSDSTTRSLPQSRMEDTTSTTPNVMPPPPSQEHVPALAAAIEDALSQHVQTQGALEWPSLETLGKDGTYQQLSAQQEADFKNHYRRQLEQRGVDARAVTPQCTEKQAYTGPGFVNQTKDPQGLIRTVGEQQPQPETKVSPFLLQASLTDETASDSDSVISGLTSVDSAVTRQILDDAQSCVADFLAQEQEAIRQIMEQDEGSMASAEHDVSLSSQVGSVSMQAAEQAEQLAEQMREILEEFQSSGSATPSPTKSAATAAREPRVLETPNTNEKWMVYYDDVYQREYYHETISNRTQWEHPTQGTPAPSSPQMLRSEHVMPDLERRGSRIAQYRRSRRRQRKRRLMGVLVATLTVGGAYFLSSTGAPHAIQSVSKKFYVAVRPVVNHVVNVERLESMVEQTVAHVTGQAQRQVVEEALARAEAERRLLVEQQARLAAERNMQEEREESERKRLEAQRLAQAEKERQARFEQEERERQARIEEEQARRQRQLDLIRPWGCNIPLAYAVHGRCRRLASENPVFNLQALIQSMMQ